MAVSVLDRPYGFQRDLTNPITSNIYSSSDPVIGASGNEAAIFETSHGLSDFSVVYIKSNVEDYNGFWYVNQITANVFNISRTINISDTQDFVKNAEITYYVCTSRKWNCVHLPIVYKLSNTLWPTNSEDTVRDISSVTDSSGYCNITAAGDIKATGSAQVLDFVKITGCSNDDLNGVWQIVTYVSDTSFVIDLPYSTGADTDLTNNASIQYYYSNYVVKVQIWGGLNNGHEWYGQKPYALLATLNLIPDENNQIKFSIADILKKQIEIENNLLLGTLPNNLDAFTMFFIKYGEEYDDSTQIYVGRTVVSYTSDMTSLEGRALNSVLPFKNVYSGAMSDYVLIDSAAKFLTNFTEPTLFTGKYFDLGFLWDGIKDVFFKLEWFLNGALVTTTYSDNIDSFYTGVYRGLLEYSGDCDDYDRVDVTAYGAQGIAAPSAWTDVTNSFDTKTATQFTEAVTSATNEVSAQTPLILSSGDKVRVRYTVVISGTWTPASGIVGPATVLEIQDGLGSVATTTKATVNGSEIQTANPTFVANGTYEVEEFLTLTGPSTQLFFSILELTGVTSGTADFVITMPPVVEVESASTLISETKTINLNCNCIPAQSEDGIYLSWLNNLGHFDYWLFTAYKDHLIDITDSGETEVNVFTEWPNSFGEFADTSKRKQTFRDSSTQLVVRSQHLTKAQVQAISRIRTSPLVQIVNSIYDRRTVIVDSDSFTEYKEENKLHEVVFTITYTDDVPSQRV